MKKLDRALMLVQLLCESTDGLTLDEMADRLNVTRRTAERLRDIILVHFDLDEVVEGRTKRFRIRDALPRVYSRPSLAEIAALQAETEARVREKAPQASLLSSLLSKIRGSLNDREKHKLEPDLEALVRLQRSRVPAGPAVVAKPDVLVAVQSAIINGTAVEFDYMAEGASEAKWRRVVPYGLVHGPITYLIGKIPRGDMEPVFFRLDRMSNPKVGSDVHVVPDDWDIDAWLSQSFGIWREEDHDIVLRVMPSAVPKARAWRFHPAQTLQEDGDELLVRFRSGGLREIADHVFTWNGDVRIEGPEELRQIMRDKLVLGLAFI